MSDKCPNCEKAEKELEQIKVDLRDLEMLKDSQKEVMQIRLSMIKVLEKMRHHDFKDAEKILVQVTAGNPKNWFGEQIANATWPLLQRLQKVDKELEIACETASKFMSELSQFTSWDIHPEIGIAFKNLQDFLNHHEKTSQ